PLREAAFDRGLHGIVLSGAGRSENLIGQSGATVLLEQRPPILSCTDHLPGIAIDEPELADLAGGDVSCPTGEAFTQLLLQSEIPRLQIAALEFRWRRGQCDVPGNGNRAAA